jgi:putative ABC transport system ATP-binding protein
MKKTRTDEYKKIVENTENDVKRLPFVAAEEITKDFEIGDYIVRAVDNLSLKVDRHEYLAIIGASGAGKTTLLHLFGGLDQTTKGKIILSSIDITPMSEETLTTFRIFNVGLVFQNYNLISSLTALENIEFPMQLCGMEPERYQKRAKELLDQVGLSEREEHLPFQLSAGEQQRIAIARALGNDPPIILADEPTANLDKKNAEFIATLFEDLRQKGKTIIIATHDEKLIKHAHRIVVMEDGKIIEDNRITEIDFIDEPIDESELERSELDDLDDEDENEDEK